jgi:FixJ family two-component response regulator
MNIQPCVFIVDDDDAVRDGLALVLETAGLTCQTFENAEHFLKSYVPGTPSCLVLDINMPGMNGEELQEELKRRNIRLPIIFLTSYGDIPTSVRAVKAGAVDFMTKPVQINLLIERIRAELQLEAQMYVKDKDDLDFRNRINGLTHREKEILNLAIGGLPNKEIAQRLGISFRTVETHRTRILIKTSTTNFLELARKCEASKVSFEPKSDNF